MLRRQAGNIQLRGNGFKNRLSVAVGVAGLGVRQLDWIDRFDVRLAYAETKK